MRNNYINKLHIKGFRCFDELDVKFNKGFNFIVGKNGCGKTSLLRAIIVAYSQVNMGDSRYDTSFEVWIDLIDSNNNQINRIGGVPNRQYSEIANLYRNEPRISLQKPPNDGVKEVYYQWDANKIKFCPLVLGAFRRIEYKQIEGMKREKNILEAREQYIMEASTSLNGGILPDIKQWMINRYFQIDKEWAKIEKKNWEWLISNLNDISPLNINFEFISIERDLEPKFKVDNKICYLEELSSGF